MTRHRIRLRHRLARRFVLPIYPRRFRAQYARDLETFWEAQRGESRYRGPTGAARFWFDVVRDAAVTGLRLRLRGSGHRGNPRRPQTQHRPVGGVDRGAFLHDLWRDAGYGVRSFARAPTFTLVSVATLAVGIGATASIFSIVNSVLLRPLPYVDPGRLVAVLGSTAAEPVSVSYPDYRDWREQVRSVADLGAHAEISEVFRSEGETDLLTGEAVSASVFPILGVRPLLGRWFTDDDDVIGAAPVMVLGHDLWVRWFGADSSVVGRGVVADEVVHTVVGVMPRGFAFPNDVASYWVPLRGDAILREAGIENPGRGLGFLSVVGRLGPGVTLESARQALTQIASQVDAANGRETRGVLVEALHDIQVGDVRGALVIFSGAVVLLLAIACANVASLWLTRTLSRSRELALRTALGASRRRVLRQLLTESIVLGLLGGVVGLGVAVVTTQLTLRLGGSFIPRSGDVHLDGAAVGFATLLSVVSGVIFGIAPAWSITRRDAGPLLYGGNRGAGGGPALGIRQTLVVSQVAMACILLTAAGLLINSFVRLTARELGFDTERAMMARIGLPPKRYASDDAVLSFFDALVEEVERLPGVDAATTIYSPPLANSNFVQLIEVEGAPPVTGEDQTWAGAVIVGAGYFEAARVPVLRGREFTRQDVGGAPPVAVVNQAMAQRYWPGEDAVGKRFKTTAGISGTVESLDGRYFARDWITVVGLAANVRRRGQALDPAPEFYRPHAQMAWPNIALLLRLTDQPTPSVIQGIRRIVRAQDPALAVTDVHTMDQLRARSVATPRFRTVLLGMFATAAAVLAVVGVYGVVGFVVLQRTPEIGLRIALGATGTQVMRGVLRRGLAMTLVGIAIGLGGALAVTRLLSGMLFGVTAHDPITYALIAATLAGVALAACYVPAYRASRIDPVRTLQHD